MPIPSPFATDERYEALMDAARAILALRLDDEHQVLDRAALLVAHAQLRDAMQDLEPTGLAPLGDA